MSAATPHRHGSRSHAHAPRHLSTRAAANHSDNSGWVEGLTGLTEDHAATALVTSDPAPPPPPPPSTTNGNGNGAAAAAAAPSSSPEEDFSGKLEHALEALAMEVARWGEIVAEIGAPDGFGPINLTETQLNEVLETVRVRADALGAASVVIRRRKLPSSAPGAPDMFTADVCVRRRPEGGSSSVASTSTSAAFSGFSPIELRVAVVGNVDSGKSTMVGVLTRSILDDGRGLARSKVFKHVHEETTGRTSSISQHTLCLDAAGNVLNDAAFRATTTADYVARAAKILTLVDLAG